MSQLDAAQGVAKYLQRLSSPIVRLAKFLAHAGVASRRAAERIVADGRVTVEGKPVVDPAFGVEPGQAVTVDGKPVRSEEHEYFMLNKPVGVVSTARDPQGRRKVVDLVPARGRVYPVGRLDADSTGLILLTNDGELANRLTHPRFEIPKTYRATLRGRVGRDFARLLRAGVELEDGRAGADAVKVLELKPRSSYVEITLHAGRKRQVRRMCEALGHRVTALERIRFGPLALGDLKPGAWRTLTKGELAKLNAAADQAGWQNGKR